MSRLPERIRFPIDNGYVTLRGVAKEAAIAGAIGAIYVGGVAYYVYVELE